MKNLEPKEGYKNRHIDGLPLTKTNIHILIKHVEGDSTELSEWKPFDPSEYTGEIITRIDSMTSYINMPAKGYQGTAKLLEGKFKGIGYHAWEQNNSEFVYWKEAK